MFGDGGLDTQLCPTFCDPIRLLCPWDFLRQEYWSGLPFTTPGDLPHPEIEPASSASPALADGVSQKDKEHYSILTHIYIEFRKMLMITLYAKRDTDV